MKHLAALFLLLAASAAFGQTVKTLGYNTTNGHVVVSTNIIFSNAITIRTNVNTNSEILNIGDTNTGFKYTGGSVDDITFQRNGVPIWSVDSGGFRAGNALFTSDVSLSYGAGSLGVLKFVGISSNTGAAISRTNLGLGATWLTNTNATNFRSAIGLGWSALTNTNAMDFYTNTLTAYSYISAAILEGLSQVREDIGLGNGITTNITFVDADTNTNSVTISNGIITGWTQ
jgi:hypothetical protein